MTARFGPRFGAESALIIAAAVLAYLLQFSWPGVAAIVFGAWFVVAVFEILAARAAPRGVSASDEGAAAQEAEAGTEVAEEPAQRLQPPPPPIPPRPTADRPAQAPAPVPTQMTETAEKPDVPAPQEAAPAPPATVAPAPPATVASPPPAPAPVAPPPPVAAPAPTPPAAAPAPPPPVAAPAPPPPVAPPSSPAAAPAPPVAPPVLPPTGDAGWNLWTLERAAREQAGRDPVRDEERSFLLMYLREFADAEGNLPDEFDGLVRDSFGDLVGSGR